MKNLTASRKQDGSNGKAKRKHFAVRRLWPFVLRRTHERDLRILIRTIDKITEAGDWPMHSTNYKLCKEIERLDAEIASYKAGESR